LFGPTASQTLGTATIMKSHLAVESCCH